MLAVGIGLFGGSTPMAELFEEVKSSCTADRSDFSVLLPLAREEADVYQRGHYILYETDRYGIAVLTDTTERSPTFSLQGFENSLDPDAPPALAYLRLPEAGVRARRGPDSRLPRGLDWESFEDRLGHQRALGFDFSKGVLSMRENRILPAEQVRFQVLSDAKGIAWDLWAPRYPFRFPSSRAECSMISSNKRC